MDRRHIIPVAPANDGDAVAVVEVKQNGSHPLDVQLVGCEGENPYVATSKICSISVSSLSLNASLQSNNVIFKNSKRRGVMGNGKLFCLISCCKNSLKETRQIYWMASAWSTRPKGRISRSRFGEMSRGSRSVIPP